MSLKLNSVLQFMNFFGVLVRSGIPRLFVSCHVIKRRSEKLEMVEWSITQYVTLISCQSVSETEVFKSFDLKK